MVFDPPTGWLIGRPGEAPIHVEDHLDKAITYAKRMAKPDGQGFAIPNLRVWSMALRSWVWPQTTPDEGGPKA